MTIEENKADAAMKALRRRAPPASDEPAAVRGSPPPVARRNGRVRRAPPAGRGAIDGQARARTGSCFSIDPGHMDPRVEAGLPGWSIFHHMHTR